MNYRAIVNGKEVDVKVCNIRQRPYNLTEKMEYITPVVDGETEIILESKIPVSDVVIRPLSAGIPIEVTDGRIIIKLKKQAKFSVEINGSFENNICVFTQEKKYDGFTAENNCIVYNRGIHNTDTLLIDKDGTTLYIEDGAIINGNIIVRNCSDVKICGYGTVSMEKYTKDMRDKFSRCIDVDNCSNVSICDITLNDSNFWSLRVNGSENVTVNDLKIFGSRGNSDGIDVCGSRNVTVSGIFTRVWDDSFVVKGFDTGNTENIVFKNSVLWNDFARPIEIGVELRADAVRNIRFENIDIIHSTTGYPILGIHHGDHARVEDIVFDNIRIEDATGAQLADIRITDSVWNEDDEKGSIRNVTFSNITYTDIKDSNILPSNSRIEGYSAENNIKGVHFHNIRYANGVVRNAQQLRLDVKEYADDITITADPLDETAYIISSEICISKEFELDSSGMYRGAVIVRLVNNNDVYLSGMVCLATAPKNTEGDYTAEFDLAPGKTSEYEFEITLQPGKYQFFIKGSENLANCHAYIDLPMIIERYKKIDECAEYKFKNYYGRCDTCLRIGADEDSIIVMVHSEDGKDTELTVYTALPVQAREGEIVFSCEEVDFGEVCALIKQGESLVCAPQLRSPLEISYVFKNEPKIKKLYKKKITVKNDIPEKITYEELGIADSTGNFIMEVTKGGKESEKYRYPYSLFRSVTPETTSHMFVRAAVRNSNV